MTDIDAILRKVTRPARYAGGEWNAVVKDWDVTPLRVALAYPDAYDIGMSNLGLAIIYDILNAQPDVLAERVYAPWPDMERELRANDVPLFSLETRHPLAEFDVIGFSLGYELTFTNVLNMLDLAGLPLLAAERSEAHPLVIAGGTAALNPEPLAAFIDAFVLGDGEEVALEIVDLLRRAPDGPSGGPRPGRRDLLHRLSQIDGVYVPSLYDVAYHEDGAVREVRPLDGAPARVRRRFLERLSPPPTRPIVPFTQTVHDRAAVEVQRGCVRGCRFCQAGVVYRPRRERPADEVVEASKAVLAGTGYDELSLLSLSTADHSEIGPMVEALRREHGERLAIALPSLRVDSFSVRLAAAAAGPGRRNITFAPEAGSQRLRDVINKPTTDDDLLAAAETAFDHGWTNLKLYFMVGLPTETLEDMQGIIDLVGVVKEAARRRHGGRGQVRVSTSIFVPKPHTPFQWAAQASEKELCERHEYLRRGLKRLGIAFSWNDTRQSLLEAMLSRGDRRLGEVVERAWRLGARFDAWNDLLDLPAWRQALSESGIDASFYARRERDEFEVLPWSHIDSGVSEAFLRNEWRKALRGETTLDCRTGACNVCGLQAYSESCAEKLAQTALAKPSSKPV